MTLNYGLPVFTVEGDFSVRLGWKPGIGDEAVSVGDAHASPFEQFALVFGLQRHLSAEGGVDGFGGRDVLMNRISVLFVIVVVIILSLCVIVNPCSVIGSKLLGVYVLEEATIPHGVIGFGMKLAGTLQGLVVVILVVAMTTWLLNRVDFMIVLAGTLASIGVAVVTPRITVVSMVVIVVAPITTVTVVIPTTVITVVIMAWWVFGV
jgi:hypothetical protein